MPKESAARTEVIRDRDEAIYNRGTTPGIGRKTCNRNKSGILKFSDNSVVYVFLLRTESNQDWSDDPLSAHEFAPLQGPKPRLCRIAPDSTTLPSSEIVATGACESAKQ